MKIITTITELRAARAQLSHPIGIVPTMGYLHAGHLSLVQQARSECAGVVATIFVNPTQFGPSEDLAAYPRDLPRDLAMLQAEGVDLVWVPKPERIYPADFQTWVTVEVLTNGLEGERRPGHFRGVTTIVAILFNAVNPDKAYFGQKDAQQAVVIRQMVKDLNYPIEVVVCPTVREADGLALSSRNTYLNPAERQAATVLYRALTAAQDAFQSGERDGVRLRQILSETLNAEPLARPQYVSCAHPDTLLELDQVADRALLSLAVYFGKTRLIDNILLEEGGTV